MFLSTFCNYAFSQNLKLLDKDILWIKQEKLNPKDSKEIIDFLNFNTSLDFSNNNIRNIKSKISNKGSFFIVFKSDEKTTFEFLTLKTGEFKVHFLNNKIIAEQDIVIDDESATKGVIINYTFNRSSARKSKVNIKINSELLKNLDIKNKIFEIIFLPFNIDSKEKNIIETYLSIKYGVSLEKNKSYLSSKGDTIWDSKKYADFSYRVTAIAHDSILELKQFKSKNAKFDGLTISASNTAEHKSENFLFDGSYLFWGDNNKNLLFTKNSNDSDRKLERVWNLQTVGEGNIFFNTKIAFDKVMLNSKELDTEDVWLAIDSTSNNNFNYDNAKYYKVSSDESSEIIFKNILLSGNSKYLFTLISAREKSLDYIIENSENIKNNYSIYPNPMDRNQFLKIEFDLKELSNVDFSIHDINGKLIKTEHLGMIQNKVHEESIFHSGIYIIKVTINGKMTATKLLVK